MSTLVAHSKWKIDEKRRYKYDVVQIAESLFVYSVKISPDSDAVLALEQIFSSIPSVERLKFRLDVIQPRLHFDSAC